ncbi:MAG: acetyl-CoA carboxylase biotin carboxyl carrier protein [Treponema sp.]|jgi:acetyl-CoA carboxylase biotin carboxyl carrier protein|nr:acetyl-CoA carboxylase biotin carboxyl carrier protein [Treponema sp.]
MSDKPTAVDESIVKLLESFSAANIAELDIEEGPLHIVFRKEAALKIAGSVTAPFVPPPAPPAQDGHAPAPVHLGLQAAGSGAPGSAPPGTMPAGEIITSPIVATFYAAPGPDAPAFVKAGGRVRAGDTLCILEAMKMMNHLEAEFDCEILDVKAASGDLVEYGQALFEVRRL